MSEDVWHEYRETGDLALRSRLVLTYVPLVKHIVYKKIRERLKQDTTLFGELAG